MPPLPRQPSEASPKLWRRVLWLDAEMRAGRHPSYDGLCARFGISRRCATQTLAFLRKELGCTVGYSRRHGGYAYEGEPPDPMLLLPVVPASAGELAALGLAAAQAARYLDRETADALAALRDRLLAAAGPETRELAGARADEVVFTGPPPLRAPHLDLLRRAIRARAVLEIEYLSPRHREPLTRVIEPHFLTSAAGDWLVTAWDRTRQAPRTFALARLLDRPEYTGEKFERRPELDPAVFSAHQFLSEGGRPEYELRLRFSPAAAQVAGERKWHPSQQIARHPDGSCELRMTVAGRGDVLLWIRGFGREVEVLAPDWLRELAAEEARAVAELYRER